MARHIWTVLCSGDAVRDTEQRLTLMEPVDHLNAFPVPSDDLIGKSALRLSSPLTIVSAWMPSAPQGPEGGQERIRLLAPDGALLETYTRALDLQPLRTTYLRREIAILKYAGLGRYEFEVALVDPSAVETRVALIPLELRLGGAAGTPH